MDAGNRLAGGGAGLEETPGGEGSCRGSLRSTGPKHTQPGPHVGLEQRWKKVTACLEICKARASSKN